ncbi:CBS domain-containing protein [Candidatus Thorarchaeota archaeon]|nr:MAG: CBS domain-containing protein [Candidatus Thorarchaeota archaeon]
MILSKDDLKHMRKEAGMTQEELAEEVGVSQAYIARMETGNLDPKLSKVAKIVEILSPPVRPTCADVMTPNPATVGARDPLAQAASIMKQRNYSQLPVMRGGAVIGYVTERDIIRNLNLNMNEVSVEAVMNRSGVPIVDELTPLFTVVPLFQMYQAVMVQKQGRLSGIITRSDLLHIDD